MATDVKKVKHSGKAAEKEVTYFGKALLKSKQKKIAGLPT